MPGISRYVVGNDFPLDDDSTLNEMRVDDVDFIPALDHNNLSRAVKLIEEYLKQGVTGISNAVKTASYFGLRDWVFRGNWIVQGYLTSNLTGGTIGVPYDGTVLSPYGQIAGTGFALPNANGALFIPVASLRKKTLNRIRIHVAVSDATKRIDVGIYKDSGERLSSSGLVNCPETGLQDVVIPQIEITPGKYWLALYCDSTVPQFTRVANNMIYGVDYVTGQSGLPATKPAPTSFLQDGHIAIGSYGA